MNETELITAGVIARRLRQPLHRVLHILATRPHIRPLARAGTLRLYSEKTIGDVAAELRGVDARKGVRHAK